MSGRPTLGTAAALNVPVSGNAASGEVVKGDDSRLAARAQIVTIQSSQAIPVPSWAVTVRVQIWGQGPASGSGRKGAPGTVACGGGAGSSAMYAEITVAAVELGGSVVCVVPGAPAGGAAVTADNTNGNPGAARTSTSAMLGDYLMMVTGGQPGAGGTASTGTAGSSSGAALPAPFLSVVGVTGGSASVTGGVGGGGNNNNWGNAGSGAGGGISDTNVAAAGGGGGYSNVGSTQLMGGTGGGVGAAGNTAVVPTGFHGAGGGGGGGAALTGAAGDGANAVGWGGASGGGGATRNGVGNSSGRGGDGTPGTIRFTFMG